jgi:hypothetical protein
MEIRSAKSRHEDHRSRGDCLTDVTEQSKPFIRQPKAISDNNAKGMLRQQCSGLRCTQHGLGVDLMLAQEALQHCSHMRVAIDNEYGRWGCHTFFTLLAR